jgi:uncharacterized protein
MSSRCFRLGRSITGFGLFATKLIKRHGYIATYRGKLLPNEEAERREMRGAKYMFELNSKWTIDGSPRWNVARYINHSCWPNAKPVTRKGKIVIVAQRDISPGEEITYDYGKEYFDYFIRIGGCLCAACRTEAAVRRSKRNGAKQTASKRTASRKRK